MNELLLSMSGVDRRILARAPRDTNKFIGLGGALLTTAVMAFISMGFALRIALHAPWVLVAVFAALWSLGIYNLDRWLVAATKRQGRWWRDIMMIIPRLGLAVMLGAIISEPLVLQVFRAEIDTELRVMRSEKQAAFETQLLNDPRYVDLDAKKATILQVQQGLAQGVPFDAVTANPEVVQLTERLEQVNAALALAEQAVACEGSGTCGSGTAGAGPVFQQNLGRRDRLLREQRALSQQLEGTKEQVLTQARNGFEAGAVSERERLATLQAEVAELEAARDVEVAESDSRIAGGDGLLARITGLHRLTSSDPAMEQARWGLFLFILVLECLPVFFKLFMNLAKPTQYDLLLQEEDEADLDRARQLKRVEREEARMQADVALDAAETQARTELDAQVAAARAVLDAQVDLVRLTADRWREEQEAKIRQDIRGFVASEPQRPAWVPEQASSTETLVFAAPPRPVSFDKPPRKKHPVTHPRHGSSEPTR